VIAIQKLGGPLIPWRSGRVDGERPAADLDQGGDDPPRSDDDTNNKSDNGNGASLSKLTGQSGDHREPTTTTSPTSPTNTNAARMARLEHIKMRLEQKKQQVVEDQQQQQQQYQLKLQQEQELHPQTGTEAVLEGATPTSSITGYGVGGGASGTEMAASHGNGGGSSDGPADWLATLNDPATELSDAEIVALCGATSMDRCCRRCEFLLPWFTYKQGVSLHYVIGVVALH
jgi:hypothetical protein